MGNNPNTNNGLVLVSEIYPDNLVVVPVENRPVFPGLTLPLNFVNKKIVQQIDYSIKNNNGFFGVALIREKDSAGFSNSKRYKTGTLLKIIKIIDQREDRIHLLAQALTRIRYRKEIIRKDLSFWQVEYMDQEQGNPSNELKAYTLAIINSVKELIQLNPMFQEQMRLALSQVGMEKPGLLMDLVASFLTADGTKLQQILETTDLYQRSEKLLILLKEEIELSQLQQDIEKQIEEKVNKQQRKFFLREQLRVIKKELGLEKDEKTSEIEHIKEKLKGLVLTSEVQAVINEELTKMQTLEPASSEYQVSRTYLNWLTDLPWGIYSGDSYNLAKARQILDRDHYGLDDVKQRILEFISTKSNTSTGPKTDRKDQCH